MESEVIVRPDFFDGIKYLDGFNGVILGFQAAVNAKVTHIDLNSILIAFHGNVDINGEHSNKINEALFPSNYNIAALDGEEVILFSRPLLISKIYCGGLRAQSDNKSDMVRLISFAGANKISTGRSSRLKGELVYSVDEIVWGIILDKNVTFRKMLGVDFKVFYSDSESVTNIVESFQNVQRQVEKLRMDVPEVISEVDNFINDKTGEYVGLLQDTDIALAEKNRLVKSNSDNGKILERIKEDISIKSNELEVVNEQVEKVMKLHDDLQLKIDATSRLLSSNTLEKDAVLKTVVVEKENLSDLRKEISDAQRDKNILTLDMKGFSKESRTQLKFYYTLAFMVALFLSVVFFAMYSNALEFEELINANSQISPLSILLGRAPLITATALILATLSGLLLFLVNLITSVHSEKMNMLKAEILAGQITESLSLDDMTEDEIRSHKRDIKIKLVMDVFSLKSSNIDEKQVSMLTKILDAVTKK